MRKILIKDRKTKQTFIAELHGIDSQPPARIRNSRARSRTVVLNGRQTQFYLGEDIRGERHGESRVNFELGGIWFHITGDPGTRNNLFADLRDEVRLFDFVTTGEPV